jgi:hypothetical protein
MLYFQVFNSFEKGWGSIASVIIITEFFQMEYKDACRRSKSEFSIHLNTLFLAWISL